MLTSLLSKRITRFLIAVGVIAVIAVLVLRTIWAFEHPPRINITRTQYEQALAQWQAQKVEEYEITTDTKAFPGGTKSLRITDYGNKVTFMYADPRITITDDGRKYFESNEAKEYLKRDTVEGLFKQIDAILRDNEVFKSGAMTSSGSFYMAYNISFDPLLGYPSRFSGRPITEPGAYVFDADFDETVTSLKIIKHGK